MLGHDFHSVLGYERSRLGGSENLRSPTWRQLVEFLARVPIALEQCFFTNAYMGLRAGAGTTGKFPGAASAPFVQASREFLLAQIAVQRPALILARGNYVPKATLTSKCQITIPAEIRGRLHLKPGDVHEFDETWPFLKATKSIAPDAWKQFGSEASDPWAGTHILQVMHELRGPVELPADF